MSGKSFARDGKYNRSIIPKGYIVRTSDEILLSKQ